MPSHPISPELLERPSAPVRDLPPRKKTPNPRSIEGGEDDGVEDVAAGGAQHQLRAPSRGATSPGGARPWCGGGADAPASPQRGGGGAAPPASQQRGRGGAAAAPGAQATGQPPQDRSGGLWGHVLGSGTG